MKSARFRSRRHVPRAALLLVGALVAGVAAGETASEFSSTAVNPGNAFSAAASFGSPAVTSSLARSTATAAAYSQGVLADNPFAYWRLGEAQGATTAVDEKSTYNGTFNSTTSPQLGQVGAPNDGNTAMAWGSSGAAATVPDAAALGLNDAFTVELWAKVTGLATGTTGSRYLVSKDAPTGWAVSYNSYMELQWTRAGMVETPAITIMTPGHWHHVVFTYDGSTLRIYGDTLLIDIWPTAIADYDGAGPLQFLAGALPTGEVVSVDEVALYGTALSEAKVQAHYRAGRAMYADPCAQYRVYANVINGGSPVTGVTSVTADVSELTAGATAVTMTAGSYTVGGTNYSYRSAPLRAGVAPGSYGYSVTWVDGGGSHTTTGLAAPIGEPVPVTPAWMTGFEAGVIATPTLFSSNSGGASGTQFRTGARSLVVAKTSTASVYTAKAGFTTTTALSFAVRFGTLPTADVTSVAYFNNSATPLYLGYQVSGSKFTLRWGSNTAAVASSSVVAGTWYAIDLGVDVSANPNTAVWRIEGVDQSAVSLGAAAQTVTDFRFGSAVTADRFTADYDDVVHSKTMFDYPLGPVSVHAVRPDGIGTHNNPGNFQNEDGTAITSSVYQRLDDATMTSLADGVRQTTGTFFASLAITMANSSTVCVRGVQAVQAHHKTTTSANSMRSNLYFSSLAALGSLTATVYTGDATGNGVLSYGTAVITPWSPRWNQTDFNGLQFLIGYASDASPPPYWDALMLEYYTMT